MKDFYSAKLQNSAKIEDSINKWKDILCSHIRRVDMAKMLISHKATYDYMQSPHLFEYAFCSNRKIQRIIHIES